MGLSSTSVRQTYTGDGSTTSFSYPNYFFKQADLLVFLFDTGGGAITPQVLNTNYTISGTPNNYGFYPNGANIVFSVAPPSTSIVVIINSPTQVQNFALGQNGNINSAALVQQLDLMTMFIQRLQDQVSRTVFLPDGVGDAFSGALPSNTPLIENAGAYFQLNQNANGVTYNTALPQAQIITVPYTALQAASTTDNFSLFTLPAGALLTQIFLKHTGSFTGSGITGVTASIGIATDYSHFISPFNVLQAPGDQVYDSNSANYFGSWSNPTTIYLQMLSTGANLSALSAGSLNVYYSYTNML